MEEPLDNRLLVEEEPPNAKVRPTRIPLWSAVLFWFVFLSITLGLVLTLSYCGVLQGP